MYNSLIRLIDLIDLKINRLKNNPENSYTTKVSKHISSGFSIFTIFSFSSLENKLGVYRGKDRLKTLKRMRITIFLMSLLTIEQQESYENGKICYICHKKFENKYLKDKKYRTVRDYCHDTGKYRGAAYSTRNLKYSVPINIPIVSHNGFNYNYHFIKKS